MLDLQNPEVLRAALEGLHTAVCLVDQDRRIRFWNDGAERITGHLRQDVLGRFCGDILLIRPHERKGAVCDQSCPLVAAMRDGQARESHVYVPHKSGYAVPVKLRAVPIRDGSGHVIGATQSFVERTWMSTRHPPDANLKVGQGLDALTGLPDYTFTVSYLADRLKFASQHTIPFGLLCLQLDQLDTLKATHGVDAAEGILKVVAHTLRNGLDPLDFVGRWSEDQFLATVANCGEDELRTTAERLNQLAQSSEITWWGDELSVTVSVGGTASRPGEALEPLLARAGNALNQALARGGNCCIVLNPPAI
jgi:diguanylate cyclase (GGDEF)-like protein/PAS domain S-box-containing protein